MKQGVGLKMLILQYMNKNKTQIVINIQFTNKQQLF